MAKKKQAKLNYDLWILVPALLLTALGIVLVYSSSSHVAAHRFGDSYFFLKRQILFFAIGLGIMLAAKKIPFTLYPKLVYPLLGVSIGLLVLLFIPGFGHKVGGAIRWLKIGSFSLQPSEFAKLSLAIYMAYSMSKAGSNLTSFSKGLLPNLIVTGAFIVLMVFQPDFGTAVIVGAWVLIVLFIAGIKLLHLTAIFILSAPVTVWLVWRSDYRIKRWLAYLNPWDDPQGIGYHIIHSFLAFGSGGVLGAGLGNSKQKLFYLPEAHTDFALSIAAEELGFVGVTCIILLFGLLVVRGIMVSLNSKDLFSSYLGIGLSCLIGLQVILNMAVVMGLLPTKGMVLPLISYGGSSLVVTLFSIGILLNISSRN
ncbi:MAG: putative lipid II flippase FtsW [Desulfatiglans sp.]|nr:putative lipid II flippase FtsW [Thermodesulfobacteriota bacterium]MEE4351295.1 putative lipid II flippase FtsW [Desulfatiglans sp.]